MGWPCLQQQNKLCAYAAADAWMTLEVYDGMLLALARVLPPSSPITSPSAHNQFITSTAPPQSSQPLPSPTLASGQDRQRYQEEVKGAVAAGGGPAAETPSSFSLKPAAHRSSSAVASTTRPKKALSTNSTSIYSCAACGVNCSSAPTLADHCLGRKHLAVLRRLQSLPPGAAGDMLPVQPCGTGLLAAAIAPSSAIRAATTASTAGAAAASRKTAKAAGKLSGKAQYQ